MSSSVQISPETIERLRDEAYAMICRKAFSDELEQLQDRREELEGTRPPFGILGSKKTREAFEQSKISLDGNIAQLQNDLLQLERIEIWLAGRIKEGLDKYLAAASLDQLVYNQIILRVDRWQSAVSAFKDHVMAYARDIKGVAKPAASKEGGERAFAALRTSTALLNSYAVKIKDVKDEVAVFLSSVNLPDSAGLPALPAFRDEAWVDRMMVLGLAKAAKELEKAETEARVFCTNDKNELLVGAERTRAACLHASQVYLDRYWVQLRAHARQHYVKPRDPREVFVELISRFDAAEKQRTQAALTRSPFATERVSSDSTKWPKQ